MRHFSQQLSHNRIADFGVFIGEQMTNQIHIDFFESKNGNIMMSEVGGESGTPGLGWRMSVMGAVDAANRKSNCGQHPVFVVGGEAVNLYDGETKAKLQALPNFPADMHYDDEFPLSIGDCPRR